MDIFTILFYQPIYNLLIVFYRLFSNNLGIAIICIAIITKLISFPLTKKQYQLAEDSKRINDEIKFIRDKYKNDKERMQQEILALQSKYLPTQLSGCLPLIIQFVFLINIYHVVNDIVTIGTESFNKVAYPFVQKFGQDEILYSNFFGVDLKLSPSIAVTNSDINIPFYLLFVVLIGITQFLSMNVFFKKKKHTLSVNNSNDKKTDASANLEEVMENTQRQLLIMFPILVTFISYSLPTGLSLYWIVQSVFAIIQQFVFLKNNKK
ncbi:MAG: YidC/Oxa1 family membrane protein insertase [Candidatus Dojkabacteria bacterium]|nr:YidC/Oxa1 family membrane protein insertase [Candidatus Dojkabacteria bacterium]